MSTDPLMTGSLVGRFYSLSSPPDPGDVLVPTCADLAWSDGDGKGLPFVRRFCRGSMPHDGELAEDGIELAYNDDGHGLWRLFFREEERRASRMLIQTRAHELSLERDPDSPFDSLQSSAKRRVLEEAKRDVLEAVLPRMRVVPLVLSDDWIWVGRRAVATDAGMGVLLSRLFGQADLDPLIFDEELGWAAASYAVLRGFIERGPQFAPDVTLLDLDIRDKALSIRATGVEDTARSMLSAVQGQISETSINRFSFEVYSDGCSIVIEVDSKGVYRGCPARSVGGLPHERLKRRFGDVRQAARRINEVVTELVAWVESLD